MKKQQKSSKEVDAVVKSLKKLKATQKDEGLLESAHRILSLQLKTIKDTVQKEDSTFGVIYYDSRVLPLPEGVRPAAVETSRLKYQIGDKQLHISLYPISAERFEIIGQLGEMKPDKILKAVLKKNKGRTAVETNKFQIFRFENVQRGKYELEISDENKIIAQVALNL